MTTTLSASATDCSMTCGGDSADECGGWSRINIYSATTPLSAVIAIGANTGLTSSSTTTPSSPSGPSATPALSPSSSSSCSMKLTASDTAGIAIGSAAAAAIVCSVGFLLFYRRYREPHTSAAYASQPSPMVVEGKLNMQVHEMEVSSATRDAWPDYGISRTGVPTTL
jgi:hypothetical protein